MVFEVPRIIPFVTYLILIPEISHMVANGKERWQDVMANDIEINLFQNCVIADIYNL